LLLVVRIGVPADPAVPPVTKRWISQTPARICDGAKGARTGIKLLQRGSESAVSKYGGLWGSPDEILSRQTLHRHRWTQDQRKP